MHDLIPLIEHYGLPFVFLNVLLEQGGMPIPAYPTLLVAAALAANSGYRPWQIVAVAVVASLTADLLWYRTGRRIGFRVLGTLCRVSLSPDYCVRRTRSLFMRFGPASLAFAKLVPGFGLLATSPQARPRTPLRTFLVFDTIGALLWSGIAVALGVVFHAAIDDVLSVLSSLGKWGLLLVAVALVGYMLAKWWQRRRFIQQLRMDRISVDELRASMVAGTPLLIVLDTRSCFASCGKRRIIPGCAACRCRRCRIGRRHAAARHRGGGLLRMPQRGIRGAGSAAVDEEGLHEGSAATWGDRCVGGGGA